MSLTVVPWEGSAGLCWLGVGLRVDAVGRGWRHAEPGGAWMGPKWLPCVAGRGGGEADWRSGILGLNASRLGPERADRVSTGIHRPQTALGFLADRCRTARGPCRSGRRGCRMERGRCPSRRGTCRGLADRRRAGRSRCRRQAQSLSIPARWLSFEAHALSRKGRAVSGLAPARSNNCWRNWILSLSRLGHCGPCRTLKPDPDGSPRPASRCGGQPGRLRLAAKQPGPDRKQ